ncbi:hypothetical protein PIB30_110490, partial [Stylosanthes scabra]|nr:hypothetical protein [Stylosanthes scabra]
MSSETERIDSKDVRVDSREGKTKMKRTLSVKSRLQTFRVDSCTNKTKEVSVKGIGIDSGSTLSDVESILSYDRAPMSSETERIDFKDVRVDSREGKTKMKRTLSVKSRLQTFRVDSCTNKTKEVSVKGIGIDSG